jgi:1,4-dihydroxy-2-naphthoyl-CoA hydrolase
MTATDATTLLHTMPLCETLDMRAPVARPDEVVVELDHAPGLCTVGGVLHGGVVMALADSAGGACAWLNRPPGTETTTVESKTNFLGAVRSGTVTATARPLHVGSSTIVVETTVADAGGRPVAKVTQTQLVLRPRGGA